MSTPPLDKALRDAHNALRNIEGHQPTEAFDVLSAFIGLISRDGSDSVKNVTAREIKAFSAKYGFRVRVSKSSVSSLKETFASQTFSDEISDYLAIALRNFISGPARKSLGIFLTPEVVCDLALATIVQGKFRPKFIADPACGTGTFLLSAHKYLGHNTRLLGSDISGRMCQLSDINLSGIRGTTITHENSLKANSTLETVAGQIDSIVTNPPFGVTLKGEDYPHLDYFFSLLSAKNLPSELIFIERALALLKTGGVLAVVLQRGIFTNVSKTYSRARDHFATQSSVEGIYSLPPETFALTGTQSNAVLAIIRKGVTNKEFWFKSLRSIGYDGTGRLSKENEVSETLQQLKTSSPQKLFESRSTKQNGWDALTSGSVVAKGESALSDYFDLIRTGSTPARSAYTSDGMFIVKVGNLTGGGIDFEPRDRNFISTEDFTRRQKLGITLIPGDILMTASAHAPKYIGKKVDIYFPPYANVKNATTVGEIMILRPKAQFDPFKLLAILRAPWVMSFLQASVVGQTAHLGAKVFNQIPLPASTLRKSYVAKAARLLKEEVNSSKQAHSIRAEIQKNVTKIQSLL